MTPNMPFMRIFLLAASLLLPQTAARGGGIPPLAKSAAEARAKTIAPFVDLETIAVVYVDVSRVETDKLFALAKTFLPSGHPTSRMQDSIDRWARGFRRAGASALYIVVSLADVPEQRPFAIVPLGRQANERALSELSGGEAFCERIGEVLFIGDQKVRQRLKAASPVRRPELPRALEAAGDSQVQAIFMPCAETRRVVEELMPTLPSEAGGGPTSTITRGALWAALGINASPQTSLRLQVQSQSNDATLALHDYLAGLLRKGWFSADKAGETLLPDVKGSRLTVDFDSEKLRIVASTVQPALDSLTRSVRRRKSREHLKLICQGMQKYVDPNKGRFPPAAIADRKGKPLLSWRVAILPYLGEEALFKKFHLDEPWDSKHNQKLIDRMPEVYRSFGAAAENGQTSYVVVVGPGSVFDGPAGISFGQITDGTSNTLMAFETSDEQAVIWTKPADHAFDPQRPAEGLTSPYPDGLLTLFCDGHTSFLPQPIEDETFRRLIIRNDGQPN